METNRHLTRHEHDLACFDIIYDISIVLKKHHVYHNCTIKEHKQDRVEQFHHIKVIKF